MRAIGVRGDILPPVTTPFRTKVDADVCASYLCMAVGSRDSFGRNEEWTLGGEEGGGNRPGIPCRLLFFVFRHVPVVVQ